MVDLDKFRVGEESHFEQLVRTFGPVVLGVARSFARDLDHADDLFQEVWQQVYRKRRSYSGRGSFEAWLHRLATNVCLSDYRAYRARSWAVEQFKHDGASQAESWGWTPIDPLTRTERREFRWRLNRALAYLSEREHEALVLRVLEERTSAEVAEIMGVKKATVRSLVRHAVKRLRRVMEDSDDEVSGYGSTR